MRTPHVRDFEDLRLNRAELYEDLLCCRSSSHSSPKVNIVWATDSYENLGEGFKTEDSISLSSLQKEIRRAAVPRVLKSKEAKKSRTKKKAEVFTPLWVVNDQIQQVLKGFEGMSTEDLIDKTFLEFTCGEAPYISSRYDPVTGVGIPIGERVGFLDFKFKLIGEGSLSAREWEDYALRALKSSYGFDLSGDSVLLARENIFLSFSDVFQERFGEPPGEDLEREICRIISFNIFQMDGLTGGLPPRIYDGVFESQLEIGKLLAGTPNWKALTMDWKKGVLECVY